VESPFKAIPRAIDELEVKAAVQAQTLMETNRVRCIFAYIPCSARSTQKLLDLMIQEADASQ
jgi:uncharacterized coiled-coil protein SlyX